MGIGVCVGDLISPMVKYAYLKHLLYRMCGPQVQRLHGPQDVFPQVDKVRVLIPNVHILGEQDPLKDLGSSMCLMCDPRLMLIYKHGFGHEIPARSPQDLKKIKKVSEKTVIRSKVT